MNEKNAYILGTERAELHRLGVQHQVWSSEAREGWKFAEFSAGQTLLDLGCGPGFCTMELAYMAGEEGKVIGVDLSANYIDFLQKSAKLHGLDNIVAQCADFNEMDLSGYILDGVYDRWALAWVPNPAEIIEKVAAQMAPGAVFVAHEYYDWSTFQTQPALPALKKAVKAAYQSFCDMDGTINIGRHLPTLFADAGLDVIRVRPMTKLATPDDFDWHWPRSFFQIYFPKLTAYLTPEEIEQALEELDELAYRDGASILCPHMVEVVAVKG